MIETNEEAAQHDCINPTKYEYEDLTERLRRYVSDVADDTDADGVVIVRSDRVDVETWNAGTQVAMDPDVVNLAFERGLHVSSLVSRQQDGRQHIVFQVMEP